MKRTISVMLGKGSVNHNSRLFMASNVDTERTPLNISYCNTPITDVYHELFDDAVKRYNKKQARSDRYIDNYYEKIRTGKQEKLFKEIILQVGNLNDMSSITEKGQLAATVLDKYMQDFQERNPNLRVFSAHLHMDEATPHLHIDFVPFVTGSKRGLDTRISLKQALAAQRFMGGTRYDTEWNQWVNSEKEQLSQVMEQHGIEWEQLGTHKQHRSVEEFKIEQRTKEVKVLEENISQKRDAVEWLIEKAVVQKIELEDCAAKLDKAQDLLEAVRGTEQFIAGNASRYDNDPEFQLPVPKPLVSAKSYHEKIATPLVRKLKAVIRSILLQCVEETRDLNSSLDRANTQIWNLSDKIKHLDPENERLRTVEKDYSRIRRFLGNERMDEIISDVKTQEAVEVIETKERHRKAKPKNYEL